MGKVGELNQRKKVGRKVKDQGLSELRVKKERKGKESRR